MSGIGCPGIPLGVLDAAGRACYMQHMDKIASTPRVKKTRDKMRAAGMRPIQIWVPDTTAPGFAAECERQARLINAFEKTPEGREEAEFWDRVAADAWNDLDKPG